MLIERLLAAKTTLRVYDPEAIGNVRALYGDRLVYCQKRDDALLGPTRWPSARSGSSSYTRISTRCGG